MKRWVCAVFLFLFGAVPASADCTSRLYVAAQLSDLTEALAKRVDEQAAFCGEEGCQGPALEALTATLNELYSHTASIITLAGARQCQGEEATAIVREAAINMSVAGEGLACMSRADAAKRINCEGP